ncbi:hypothetical protein BC941DRAFT_352855 [Chlamydoabsidia padenii]|nr:hypothetical protein BC941DRAFT_352855 [Chlamydoabsidia padenii]
MANEYPNAHFTGIDILDFDYLNASSTDEDNNVVLPRHVPANCQFKQVDVLQSIDLPTASFDHVFQRFMFNVYPMDGSMQHKFKELAGLVKPGGYMEFIEPDTMPRRAGPKYTLLAGVFNEKMKSPNDQVIFQGLNIKKCLLDAGLEDVRSDYTSVPICWGGYVGKMLYESALPILSKVGEILWPYLGMEGDYDEKVYLEFVDSCFNECVEYKTYLNFYWAYGRRPLDDVNKET